MYTGGEFFVSDEEEKEIKIWEYDTAIANQPILSKKMASNNINKENPNYKTKFIVIKNDGSNINSKIRKKRKLRKRYRMCCYYKITKNFKKKK